MLLQRAQRPEVLHSIPLVLRCSNCSAFNIMKQATMLSEVVASIGW
jgi:hypothetical protein